MPGDLIERIDGDVSALASFFSQFAVSLLGSALLVLGILLALFHEDASVGLVFSAFTLLTLVVLHRVRGVVTPAWIVGRQASADLFAFGEERLVGIDDLRANNAVADTMLRLARVQRAHFRARRAARMMSEVLAGSTGVLLTLGSVGALALGAYLFTLHGATIGAVYLILTYTGLLLRPLRDSTAQVGDLQQAAASITRVAGLFRLQPAVQDGTARMVPDGAPSVCFATVSFRYPTGALVLRQVSFDVPAGTVLGVLGRTGSGKTTLARLLCRLYDPTEGVIQLHGQDIRGARVADLRQHIGVVTQDVQIFQATVRDNLTFFDRSISDERLQAVLDEVGLTAWCAALPRGLDTLLDGGASALSAGEAQLLACARVFLRNPGLIILDEATSRLNPATEDCTTRAMERVRAQSVGSKQPMRVPG